jgi:fatty acid desaturase (delta-4 desaturase)
LPPPPPRYQAFFFLPLLSFYWLSSVFNTQLLDLNQRGSAQIMDWSNDYTKRRIPVSLLLRALYIGMNIVNPFFHHSPATALYHIWIMSTVESLFLSGLFSLSHNFEGADRYPVDHFEKTGEQVCWMKAQVSPSASEAAYQGGGSMMTYKTSCPVTIMRVAGSATSALRKPQNVKRVRNDEA